MFKAVEQRSLPSCTLPGRKFFTEVSLEETVLEYHDANTTTSQSREDSADCYVSTGASCAERREGTGTGSVEIREETGVTVLDDISPEPLESSQPDFTPSYYTLTEKATSSTPGYNVFNCQVKSKNQQYIETSPTSQHIVTSPTPQVETSPTPWGSNTIWEEEEGGLEWEDEMGKENTHPNIKLPEPTTTGVKKVVSPPVQSVEQLSPPSPSLVANHPSPDTVANHPSLDTVANHPSLDTGVGDELTIGEPCEGLSIDETGETDCHDKKCRFCPSYQPGEDDILFSSALDDMDHLQRTLYPVQEGVDLDNPAMYSWLDWSMSIVVVGDESMMSPSFTVPPSVSGLSNKELRERLTKLGAHVGGVTTETRPLYEQYLVRLECCPSPKLDSSISRYPPEIVSCIRGEPQADWSESERQLVKEYAMPVSGRSYRQGTSKTFFNYLLIDPRVADQFIPTLASFI
eukprot:sb/3464494/